MELAVHRKVRPYKRKIHLRQGIFTYNIRGQCEVSIRNPTNTVTCKTDSFEMNDSSYAEWFGHTGGPVEDYYDDCYPTPYPQITPKLVKEFIVKHLKEFLK